MPFDFTKRIIAFGQLGVVLRQYLKEGNLTALHQAILQQSIKNHWFTVAFINKAIFSIAEMLESKELLKLEQYYQNRESLDFEKWEKIAVISAGNIPLAGFHDFFAVLVSGNKYIGKLSSQDNVLLPIIANLLIEIEPSFQERISFMEKLADFDKIIATGSNNSSRYFEYYFGKYPHILRKNRNSLAILTGNETCEELERLFDDIFLYFGLGCRSISLLWIPKEYDFNKLITVFTEKSVEIAKHHHYLNNIDYQKTIRLMSQTPFIDIGIALLMEERALPSPIGIVHYQYYSNFEEVKQFMTEHRDEIQCAVGNNIPIENVAALGLAQSPNIIDFADGVDTILWATKSTKS